MGLYLEEILRTAIMVSDQRITETTEQRMPAGLAAEPDFPKITRTPATARRTASSPVL